MWPEMIWPYWYRHQASLTALCTWTITALMVPSCISSPPPQEARKRVGRSQALTVHQFNGLPLEIQAPFGIELVTVMASQTQLFLNPRAGAEESEAYVNALRQVLIQEEAKTTITATFSLLTTRDNQ